jgi:hypothetical protein
VNNGERDAGQSRTDLLAIVQYVTIGLLVALLVALFLAVLLS